MIELLQFLARREAEFLLIGGRGLEAHGYVRNTRDLDLLIPDAERDAFRERLQTFGYVRVAETPVFSRWVHEDSSNEDLDLLQVDDDTFGKLQTDSVAVSFGESQVRAPSIPGMVALKLHAMRNDPGRRVRDTQDIQSLLSLNPDALGIEELRALCDRYGPEGIFEQLRSEP